MTHPITRSHHGLLLAAQFVEDVVGKLDAARPQLSCRERDTGYEGVREREGETEFTGSECVFLDFYFEDTQSIKEKKLPTVMTFKSFQQSGEVTGESVWFYRGLYLKVSVV